MAVETAVAPRRADGRSGTTTAGEQDDAGTRSQGVAVAVDPQAAHGGLGDRIHQAPAGEPRPPAGGSERRRDHQDPGTEQPGGPRGGGEGGDRGDAEQAVVARDADRRPGTRPTGPGTTPSCGATRRAGAATIAQPTAATPAPARSTRASSLRGPNQPAVTAPATSSATSPRETVVSDSAGHPQPPTAEPDARAAGGCGQPGEDGGPAADAHPGPGEGEERDRGDQQAQGAEPEQDRGHRRGAQPVPSAGGGGRVVLARVRRQVGRERPGDGASHRNHGAEPDQQRVGVLEGAQQLVAERVDQGQRAGGAGFGSWWQERAAVGAPRRVRVSGHVPIHAAAAGRRPANADSAGAEYGVLSFGRGPSPPARPAPSGRSRPAG